MESNKLNQELKEDIKHFKAKDKKLKETIVKEKEKAEKARDSIPKQVCTRYLCVVARTLSLCLCALGVPECAACVVECAWMKTGEGDCRGGGHDGQDGKAHPCRGRGA